MADSNGKPAAENEDDVSHIFFSIIFSFIEIIFICALISFDPKTIIKNGVSSYWLKVDKRRKKNCLYYCHLKPMKSDMYQE